MRILHVISSPASGGAEVYVKDLVIELKNKGHYVVVGFLEHARDTGRSQEYENLFLAELESAEVPYFFIGHDTRKKIWLGAIKIRQYVKNNNIDIYHAHLPYSVLFSILIRIPCVYTHHTIAPKMSPMQYFIFNKIIDSYVGISVKCSKSLSFYTGRIVTTIHNGVDLSKIIKREANNSKARRVEAIAVGRIQPPKNYFLMVDIISMLPKEILSRFHLSIAGEGTADETALLVEYIKKKDLEDIITLLGNRNDIPTLLAKSDVFLMSSAWEGLPIALIEASATGLPCIVTDVGGCSEIIEQCENGFVVQLKELDTYSEKLSELILNENLRLELSSNALARRNAFDIKNSANKHVALYRKLIGSL